MIAIGRTAVAVLIAGVLGPGSAAGQWPPEVGGTVSADAAEPRVATGLREALRVGAGNAVDRTGRLDGFLGNEAIKILVPDNLRRLESGLRAIGYGPKVDEFIVAMNRAAERAAASAKPIFWDAVRTITIEDAASIFSGGDTAATEYFRERTEEPLTTAFRPIVEKATDEFGVTRQYKELLRGLPLGGPQGVDIDEYVVAKTLDGLFHVLGEEEAKIRRNPTARVTAILREVFGR